MIVDADDTWCEWVMQWMKRNDMMCRVFFFLMIRRPPRSTQSRSSAASDVYKRQSIDDYFNNVIKKHELTRKDKEEDRMKHVRVTNANVEPVFFAYKSLPELDNLILSYAKEHEPIYDFTANDGVGHHFWVINEKEINEKIQKLFAEMPALYVADGHHRTAAAALVGKEKREQHPNYTGNEEFNYFMAVAFPDNQLTIIDYNRVVKDLNGLSKDEFLQKLSEFFDIENKGTEEYKPNKLHNFSMYLGGNWYSLTAKKGTYNDNDPIGVLDVTILSDLVLNNLLGIKDLRTDKRIDFVGGIRGLGELKRRCLLYTSPSPRDRTRSRMPSSA